VTVAPDLIAHVHHAEQHQIQLNEILFSSQSQKFWGAIAQTKDRFPFKTNPFILLE
jgi:hypothetical protein